MSPFQAVKTWKTSTDPDYEAKKNRVLELYAIADGTAEPGPGDPAVVICMDEFGPLSLQPHPGKQWAPAAVGKGAQDRPLPAQRRRKSATVRLLPPNLRARYVPVIRARSGYRGHPAVSTTPALTCGND